MRRAKGFVYFTKKEERIVFACYYEALIRAKMDGARRNLEFVRANFIDGMGVLKEDVWENFLNVCCQLNVPSFTILCDVIAEHPIPGKGACYRIPSEKSNRMAHLKALAKRRTWRDQYNSVYTGEQGILEYMRLRLAEGKHEMSLTTHDIDRVRNTKTDPIAKLQRAVDARKRRREFSVVEGGVR